MLVASGGEPIRHPRRRLALVQCAGWDGRRLLPRRGRGTPLPGMHGGGRNAVFPERRGWRATAHQESGRTGHGSGVQAATSAGRSCRPAGAATAGSARSPARLRRAAGVPLDGSGAAQATVSSREALRRAARTPSFACQQRGREARPVLGRSMMIRSNPGRLPDGFRDLSSTLNPPPTQARGRLFLRLSSLISGGLLVLGLLHHWGHGALL